MADLVFIVIIVAFFGLAVLLVRACDRIIGVDNEAKTAPKQSHPVEDVAA